MYYLIVVLLMFVLPAGSAAAEWALHPTAGFPAAVLKGFVFWSVGVRLLAAGLRQVFRPEATAEGILGIDDPRARIVVRELGFANLAVGMTGILSLFFPSWADPAAVAGGLFLGLAGGNHALQSRKTAQEKAAMLSDLFVCLVLFACLASAWFR
jgi:hypothetical protein